MSKILLESGLRIVAPLDYRINKDFFGKKCSKTLEENETQMKKYQIALILILGFNYCFCQLDPKQSNLDSTANFKTDSLYILGKKDGLKNKTKSHPGLAAFIITVVNPPIGGIFTIVASTKKPNADHNLLENSNGKNDLYKKGFVKGLSKTKNRKLWTGAGIAGAGWLSFVYIMLNSMGRK